MSIAELICAPLYDASTFSISSSSTLSTIPPTSSDIVAFAFGITSVATSSLMTSASVSANSVLNKSNGLKYKSSVIPLSAIIIFNASIITFLNGSIIVCSNNADAVCNSSALLPKPPPSMIPKSLGETTLFDTMIFF